MNNEKPTLLQINATCNFGSTGHIVEQIAIYAEKFGWCCYIAHGARYIRNSSISTYLIGSKLDNILHAFISMFLGRNGLGSVCATYRLIRFIKRIKPDIIHLHNIHGYYINYPILFRFLNNYGVPVVWTLHDCWSMTGQCTHFESVGCTKWKEERGCHHCPQLNASYKTYIDRSNKNWRLKKAVFSNMGNLTIVPVSYWLEGIVRQSFLKNLTIKTIRNGIDTSVFVPIEDKPSMLMKYGLVGKQYVIGVATDWSDKKGLSDYCKLANIMPPDVLIVLLGLDEQKSKEMAKYGIIGITRTDDVKELVALYNGATIVMNLSYEESFGLTPVEGFACGVPSIVYKATASPELVTPETGIIVEPGNIDGVSEAIQTIIKNGKGYYSQPCRERAINYFDKNDRFREYVKLYEELIKAN